MLACPKAFSDLPRRFAFGRHEVFCYSHRMRKSRGIVLVTVLFFILLIGILSRAILFAGPLTARVGGAYKRRWPLSGRPKRVLVMLVHA
jgi:hypothetical protein